ncbi:MAG: MFS transporter [Hyphococcus sp.]|nr:MAG: MFS transporter [Marinicaulis sp.]
MRRMLISLAALLISAGILLAGGGLQGTLVSIRANMEGFSLFTIGVLSSGYYAGFIAGCLATPGMVARAGHIRAFAALSAMAAAAALTYALSVEITLWVSLRILTGFCFAGLYMIIESWINEKSSNENRGQVLSVYRIVDLTAMTIGQFLLTAADPKSFVLFSLVAVLICVSIVPVAMTKAIAPEPLAQAKLNLPKLLRVSPFAVAGALAVGLSNGAFWAIGPVYVIELGFGTGMVATFMSVAIIVGALAQWPIGYLSDLIDRRKVLIITALAACASGLFLSSVDASTTWMVLAGGGLYGAFAMSIFGLSAAHANDHAESNEFVIVTAGLLLIYGMGSVVGPILAPLAMNVAGAQSLFLYTAVIHSTLFGFGVIRLFVRRSLPADQQEDYVLMPKTTPGAIELDPRNNDDYQ